MLIIHTIACRATGGVGFKRGLRHDRWGPGFLLFRHFRFGNGEEEKKCLETLQSFTKKVSFADVTLRLAVERESSDCLAIESRFVERCGNHTVGDNWFVPLGVHPSAAV